MNRARVFLLGFVTFSAIVGYSVLETAEYWNTYVLVGRIEWKDTSEALTRLSILRIPVDVSSGHGTRIAVKRKDEFVAGWLLRPYQNP